MKKPSLLILGLIALAAILLPAIFIARKKEIGKSPSLIRVWSFLWRSQLTPEDHVVQVKGWRTATIDGRYGSRRTSLLIPEWAFWDPMWKHYLPNNPFWKTINRLLHPHS